MTPPQTAPSGASTQPETSLVDRLDEDDIRAAVNGNAFRNGEFYRRQGRVRTVTVFAGGERIEARVQGSERRPYNQSIGLTAERDGSILVAGLCSCPVGVNCKHVAAALLAVLHGDGTREQAVPRIAPPRSDAPPHLRTIVPASPAVEALGPELRAWIDRIERLHCTETEDYPANVWQRLLYLLEFVPNQPGAPQFRVQPTSARLLKSGAFASDAKPYPRSSFMQGQHALFIRPSDRAICENLLRLPQTYSTYPWIPLSEERGAATLAAMIATGRTRWGSVAGPTLTAGVPRDGRIVWRLGDRGDQYPDVEVAQDEHVRVARLAPPHYVDLRDGAIGPVETGLPPRTAEAVLSAPAISHRQGDLVRTALRRRAPAFATAVEPPPLPPPERVASRPVPGLRLTACTLVESYGYGWRASGGPRVERIPVAQVFFCYGPARISASDRQDLPIVALDGRVLEVKRDFRAERRTVRALAEFGFAKLTERGRWGVPEAHRGALVLGEGADDDAWYDALYRTLPALRDQGWIIEVADDFPVRLVRADGPVNAELREGSGIDWFELDLGVTIDGERLDLLPVLLTQISRPNFTVGAQTADDRAIYVPLPDGRVLAMPAARLDPILSALRELFASGVLDSRATGVGMALLDAPALADLEAAAIAAGSAWRGGERIREIGRLLRETAGIPAVRVPDSFTGSLRPYQARGMDWLQFLRAAGIGGVLADEMGLGKTVQTLAHLAVEKAEGRLDRPALIVAPTSLMANWRREAERFAPHLKILTLHGAARKTRFGDIAGHDIVLTTYPLLARDHAALAANSWHMIVLDEAQTIKNPLAITTRLVRTLEARHRLCLTGTPLENHLGELWSLFAFLSPGFLGDRDDFNRRWRAPIEKKGDGARRQSLARRVRPFLLRRIKAEVASELPPKTEIVEAVEMISAQRDLYESIRLAMHAKVRDAIAAKGLARSRIIVLDALLKLRQVCCDPRLLRLETAARKAGSAKLGRLLEMLPTLLEEGRRILLFSQFTSMLALIEKELQVPYALLTGNTRDREAQISRFQDGEVPIFLISLKAGGFGLNLTAADTVIHYDPWWNPAVEDQATDRAHRIGQVKPVFVHKLVMLASIEEKMDALKARKRALAAALFDPEAGSTLGLTEADIETLFGAG